MHTKLTIPERLKDLRVSEKRMSLQELSDAMVFHISQVHFTYAIQQFYKFFITLCNRRTQFIAVYIIVIEQSGKVTLCLTAFR